MNNYFSKQKVFMDFIGRTNESDAHLSIIIEDMIKEKFQLKGGYGDLIANEEKYEEFVKTFRL